VNAVGICSGRRRRILRECIKKIQEESTTGSDNKRNKKTFCLFKTRGEKKIKKSSGFEENKKKNEKRTAERILRGANYFPLEI